MKKETVEKVKSATIVVLVLIIVFGASYFTSELQECDNEGSSKTTTSSTDTNSSNDNSSSGTTSTSSDIPEDEQGELHPLWQLFFRRMNKEI